MKKKLEYKSPVAITEIVADADILTGSLTLAAEDDIFEFGADYGVTWKG